MSEGVPYDEFLKTLGWVRYECERGGVLVSERYYGDDMHEDVCYRTTIEELYPAFRHWMNNRYGAGRTTVVPSTVEFRSGLQMAVAQSKRNMHRWRAMTHGGWRRIPSDDNPFELDAAYGHILRVRPYCVREYEKFERDGGMGPTDETASTTNHA